MQIPTLTTDRLTLRAPGVQDLPAYRAFNQSERSRWAGGPRDRGETFRHYALQIGHWAFRGFGNFAVVKQGETTACGLAGPWFPDGWAEPEFGWLLWSEKDEGTGLALEAVVAARAWAYETQGWNTAVSYIHPQNARSIALALRLGGVDDSADSAKPDGYPDTLVYRHPGPEAL